MRYAMNSSGFKLFARAHSSAEGLGLASLATGSPRGPVILAGAPQSGKSTCIKVVMRAPSMDLDDPFKDPMEAAATQVVSSSSQLLLLPS